MNSGDGKPKLGRLVFEAWRDASDAPGDAPSTDDAKLISSIGRAIRTGQQVERRRRVWRRCGAAAAGCAVLLGVFGWFVARGERAAPVAVAVPAPLRQNAPALVRLLSGNVVAVRAGATSVVRSDRPLALHEQDSLTTGASSGAKLDLPRGVAVTVAPSTQLVIERARALDSRLRLQLGSMEIEVPKLDEPRRMVVQTPEAEVIVLGTHFVVEVRSADSGLPGATVTSVQVSRGSVRVRRDSGEEALLIAGGSWESAPPSKRTAADPTGERSASPTRRRGNTPTLGEARSPTPAPAEKLTLENRLFQSALDARNSGDAKKAAELLGELLVRHPRSKLAHEARIERFRLLLRSGDTRAAVRDAQRYLRDYPRGIATDEALRIVERARE